MHKADQAAPCDRRLTAIWPLLCSLPKRPNGREKKDLRSQILQAIDEYKEKLKKLQVDSLTADISYIRETAAEKEASAVSRGPNYQLQEKKNYLV